MADNYIENKFEELQARKAREQRARQTAWKKRMDAYRKKLAAEAAGKGSEEKPAPEAQRPSADRGQEHPEP